MLDEEKMTATLETIQADIKKIKRYIFWQRTYSLITILFIVVPIILGFIYLPPMLQQLFGTYRDILSPR